MGRHGAHQAYMAEMHQRGWVIAYGPVAGAAGDYGAGFWAVPGDVDLTSVITNEPAIRANAGFGNDPSYARPGIPQTRGGVIGLRRSLHGRTRPQRPRAVPLAWLVEQKFHGLQVGLGPAEN